MNEVCKVVCNVFNVKIIIVLSVMDDKVKG